MSSYADARRTMGRPGRHGRAASYGLPDPARSQLSRLADVLAADPEAPTSIREPQAIEDDHLADALVALALPAVQSARAIVDIGSGAGVPGLPLAIALPACHVWLLESNRRKCEFLVRAVEACGLVNATIVNSRAESWAEGFGRFDVATVRAVAALDVAAEYASPLLRVGGRLVAWRGQHDPREEAEGDRAAKILGLELEEPLQVWPYPAAEHRYLHVMSKVMETPSRFPRRPGVAAKRPLGRVPAGPRE
jgi:16S rRNA (guanine527-N7)-methyltransferase